MPFWVEFNYSDEKEIVLGVWQDFPGEIKHTHLLTPDWEPTADQSMDPTKVRLGELMGFMIFL